ncbi:hypothetical protein UFOVP503_48 [uncultured Caudovirales phage]|uniref:DNA transfer protein n=1 Tax=uncultured Caudovirales phage TaxID=2100421 RepID=A0A6J5MKU7_9CAUD|nr:hypothetical protein UFOVP503_48 [uncultured Caudovirales phage]CAB4161316.1 hypothetical protein UFOVP763_42 [uncultured Caudovirales phage]
MTYLVAAAITAGGAIIGGSISANASRKAAGVQADAANRATDIQSQQYSRTEELNEPYRQAGIGALNKLITASDYTPFGMDQFQADPGYAFRLAEGQKAIERSAAARGMQLSGSMLKGLTNYGQGAASQEYSNAFNRYQAERSARLNPLQTLAGIGQSATSQVGAAGQNYANAASDLTTSGAAARGSGYVGSANALNQAIGSAGNAYMSGQILNRFMPSRSSSYGQPMVDPSTYYTPAQYNYEGIG